MDYQEMLTIGFSHSSLDKHDMLQQTSKFLKLKDFKVVIHKRVIF